MGKGKILIATDSFKECADSTLAVELIYQNLKIIEDKFELIKFPLSDGGDGFLKSIQYRNPSYDFKEYIIRDYYNRLINVPVLVIERVLYLESANIIGLKLLKQIERNPLNINTSPLGLLLKKIDIDVNEGILDISKVVLGIGGTATNDLGLGLCEEFGLQILDKHGQKLKVVSLEFNNVSRIIWEKYHLSFELEAVIDVQTPLLGKTGSAALFAKQKGASDEELIKLEEGFANILQTLKLQRLYDENIFLFGAGGGLAAGLQIFFSAGIIHSGDFIKNELKGRDLPESVDYFITGEGSFDYQSYLGKSTGLMLNKYEGTKGYYLRCCKERSP
jgi:glycerate kinase